MDLEIVKKKALNLSIKNWNRYYHVIKDNNNNYVVDRYNIDNKALFFFFKGDEYEHLNILP